MALDAGTGSPAVCSGERRGYYLGDEVNTDKVQPDDGLGTTIVPLIDLGDRARPSQRHASCRTIETEPGAAGKYPAPTRPPAAAGRRFADPVGDDR